MGARNLTAAEVFTPNSSPRHTYVDRSDLDLEGRLRDAFSIKNMAVSISGPSKSGKTVLLKRVVDADCLVDINGASLKSPEDLWRTILSWMDVPATYSESTESGTGVTASLSAEGKAKIPFVAEGGISTEGGLEKSWGKSTSRDYANEGMAAVAKEIGDSDFVVFIDDFHYIPQEYQAEIGRNIKAVIERGVKVCTASVPHRADDVVRSNPELRGRLSAVDLGYWSDSHLKQIADQGFRALNVDLAPSVVERMAKEAFGSPQLMQSLCLNLCFKKGIRDALDEQQRIEVSDTDLRDIFLQTSTFTDWSSLVERIHGGPRQRGTERKTFDLVDGSEGDVYRAVLMAMASDPPKLSMRYDEMLARIKDLCGGGETPVGSSVNAALQQITQLSRETEASAPAIEWDEDVLDIVEPYLLFYLRGSRKLAELGGV